MNADKLKLACLALLLAAGSSAWAADEPAKAGKTTNAARDVSPRGIGLRLGEIADHADKGTMVRAKVSAVAKLLLAKEDMPLQFLAPANGGEDGFRAELQKIQQGMALRVFKLSTVLEELEELADDVANDAKEWQIYYLYVKTHAELRQAFYHEYNFQLGKMRAAFPPRDPAKDRGWQLKPAAAFADPTDAVKHGQRARAILQQLAKEHAGTAFEAIAKAEEKEVIKGLQWEGWPR